MGRRNVAQLVVLSPIYLKWPRFDLQHQAQQHSRDGNPRPGIPALCQKRKEDQESEVIISKLEASLGYVRLL